MLSVALMMLLSVGTADLFACIVSAYFYRNLNYAEVKTFGRL